MSNSQLNKLKSRIKNGTQVTLNLSSNLIGNSNDETSFPHKLLITDIQLSKIRKSFANDPLANKKYTVRRTSICAPNLFGSSIPIKEMISLANSIKNSC